MWGNPNATATSEVRLLSGKVAWVTRASFGLGRLMAARVCAFGAWVAIYGTCFDSSRSFGQSDSMEQVARDIGETPGRRDSRRLVPNRRPGGQCRRCRRTMAQIEG